MADSQDRSTALETENARLRAEIERLKSIIEDLHRGQKRQAAPFSKGEPKPNPKPPGRKAADDYGTKAHRQAPPQVDEVYGAPLPYGAVSAWTFVAAPEVTVMVPDEIGISATDAGWKPTLQMHTTSRELPNTYPAVLETRAGF